VQVVSIEHEDPFVPPEVGIPEAARLLKASIEAAQADRHAMQQVAQLEQRHM
jgi:hypothetical protein